MAPAPPVDDRSIVFRTVDLKRRNVLVCVLDRARYECLVEMDGTVRSTVLPGLEIDVAALFAGL